MYLALLNFFYGMTILCVMELTQGIAREFLPWA